MYFENINFDNKKKPIVLFLLGPTACGKSNISINLCKFLPVEIISVDSALIYRGMDIGTDKPNSFTLLKHPHHLLNIKDPSEKYSAQEFTSDALKAIHNIIKSGKIPFLVGGTMFYYHALLYGLSNLPSPDYTIREYLLYNFSNKKLHNQLELIDPISAERIHPNDVQRLLRALEIFYISGKNVTEYKKSTYIFPYTVLQFVLLPPDKNWLISKIQLRVKKMLKRGLQKEVETLFLRGDLHINLPSMRCIGYRQIWEYLEYKITFQDMFKNIVYATKKLAKHQLTWIKKWKNVHSILCDLEHNIIIRKILDIINFKTRALDIFREK